MGFTTPQVKWAFVPFDNSFKPGAKPFDFYLAQVSYTAKRAQAVDFSSSYYDVNQAVVALKSDKYAHATSIAALQRRQARHPARDDQLRLHHERDQAVAARPAPTTR